jgi:hypothetical protein
MGAKRKRPTVAQVRALEQQIAEMNKELNAAAYKSVEKDEQLGDYGEMIHAVTEEGNALAEVLRSLVRAARAHLERSNHRTRRVLEDALQIADIVRGQPSVRGQLEDAA